MGDRFAELLLLDKLRDRGIDGGLSDDADASSGDMSLNEACRTRRSDCVNAFPPRTETSRLIAAEPAPDRL